MSKFQSKSIGLVFSQKPFCFELIFMSILYLDGHLWRISTWHNTLGKSLYHSFVICFWMKSIFWNLNSYLTFSLRRFYPFFLFISNFNCYCLFIAHLRLQSIDMFLLFSLLNVFTWFLSWRRTITKCIYLKITLKFSKSTIV